ncbi:MAG: hypothetical protein WA639_15950, partial [Candidatus Acidiferrum sp.]
MLRRKSLTGSNEIHAALPKAHDEDVYTIRAAASSYAKAFHSHNAVADDFISLGQSSRSIDQRAACIEALISVWPERPELASIGLGAKSTEIPLLQTLGLLVGARLGKVSQEDAVDALELATDRIGGSVPYQWSDLLGPLLLEVGKIHPSMIKLACLYAVQENVWSSQRSDVGIDRATAWFVLVNSYAKDADVISLVAKEMEKEYPFLSIHHPNIWKFIASNYRGVEEIERASDARIVRFNV